MLVIILIYILVLMGLGIYDLFRVKDFDEFVVAGKSQGLMPVFLSLMATVLGASATIGVCDKVLEIGFAAVWWLGAGAVGLLLQAILLSEKIRNLNASTLPDTAYKLLGSGARVLLSVIISISWVGVIAAQLVSMTKIISAMLPHLDSNIILTIIGIIVIVYTLSGGQISVIRTDILQSVIIFCGVVITFIYIFSAAPANVDIRPLNDSFRLPDLAEMLLITGGTYFLGPDIISRNLIAYNGKIAKRAVLISAAALAIFSVIITLVGMRGASNMPSNTLVNPLIYIMNNCVPLPIAALLSLALVSALLSSADTCIINAASIIEHDILKRSNINEVRAIICIIGIISLAIAMFNTDIIGLLTDAYSVYVPGIVCPLFFAVFFHRKRALYKPLWYIAVVSGGVMGIMDIPITGMGISFVLSGISVLIGTEVSE